MWTRLSVFSYGVPTCDLHDAMNAERPCKKARCLSAASKRSEQLPERRRHSAFWRAEHAAPD